MFVFLLCSPATSEHHFIVTDSNGNIVVTVSSTHAGGISNHLNCVVLCRF